MLSHSLGPPWTVCKIPVLEIRRIGIPVLAMSALMGEREIEETKER